MNDNTFFAYACSKLHGDDEQILKTSEDKEIVGDFAMQTWESMSAKEQQDFFICFFSSRLIKDDKGNISLVPGSARKFLKFIIKEDNNL